MLVECFETWTKSGPIDLTKARDTGNAPPLLVSSAHRRKAQRRMAPGKAQAAFSVLILGEPLNS